MKEQSSATQSIDQPLSGSRLGVAWGFLGVLAFSFTVPLTRLAVGSGHLSALFVGSGRAVIAAALAGGALVLTRSHRPRGRQWLGILVVAAGAVIGFPLLTSFALTRTPASHGAMVIALLPAVTALVSVLRTRERPRAGFWWAVAAGAVAAVAFAVAGGGGVRRGQPAGGPLFAPGAGGALGDAGGGIPVPGLG
ncbi:EamA family transporter, partial [Microbacterium gorillae]|uniref:EamA family transporter n=1 Tax=Microbacterium gorillae TaxID=1231063 RepID=UPI0012B5AFF0